jgi:hypothetical protein
LKIEKIGLINKIDELTLGLNKLEYQHNALTQEKQQQKII